MAKTTKLLTTTHLVTLFGVSSMTIANWRKGIVSRDPLPTEQNGRNVGFLPAKIKAWAKKYDVQLHADPVALLAGIAPPAADRAAVAVKPKSVVATLKAASNRAAKKAAKPVAKKAATATHQKPTKKSAAPVYDVSKTTRRAVSASVEPATA